ALPVVCVATSTAESYPPSLHDALPISLAGQARTLERNGVARGRGEAQRPLVLVHGLLGVLEQLFDADRQQRIEIREPHAERQRVAVGDQTLAHPGAKQDFAS